MEPSPRKTKSRINRMNLITIPVEDRPMITKEQEEFRIRLLDAVKELSDKLDEYPAESGSANALQIYRNHFLKLKNALSVEGNVPFNQLQKVETSLNDLKSNLMMALNNRRPVNEVSSGVESIDLTEDDDGHDMGCRESNQNPFRNSCEDSIGFSSRTRANPTNIQSDSSRAEGINRINATQTKHGPDISSSSLPSDHVPSAPSSLRPRDPRRPPVVNLDELKNSLIKTHGLQKERRNCYVDKTQTLPSVATASCSTSQAPPSSMDRYDAYNHVSSKACESYANEENILNQTLSAINPRHFPASIPLEPEILEQFSKNSAENENIRAWENKCKPAFAPANPVDNFERNPRISAALGNVTDGEPLRRVNEPPNNASSIKLSDFLSQQMKPVEPEPVFSPTYVGNVRPQPPAPLSGGGVPPAAYTYPLAAVARPVTAAVRAIRPNAEPSAPAPVLPPLLLRPVAPVPRAIPPLMSQPVPALIPARVPAPVPRRHFKVSSTPTTCNTSNTSRSGSDVFSKDNPASVSKSTQESSEPKSNIRGKLAQEIEVMHKAGDSSKIRGSLKILKKTSNDVDGSPAQEMEVEPSETANGEISSIDPRLQNVASQRDRRRIDAGQSKSNIDATSLLNEESEKKSPSTLPNKTKVPPEKQFPHQNQLAKAKLRSSMTKNFTKNIRNNPGYVSKHQKGKVSEVQQVNANRMNSENITDFHRKREEQTEFHSPLSDIYTQTSTPKTGKGYGPSKTTKGFDLRHTFKIPKKNVNPKQLESPFLKQTVAVHRKQVQNSLQKGKIVNVTLNPSKMNCANNKSNESRPGNYLIQPKPIVIRKKKKKKNRLTRPAMTSSDDETEDVNAVADSTKSVDSENQDPVKADSSEAESNKKSQSAAPTKVDKIGEAETCKSKPEKKESSSGRSEEKIPQCSKVDDEKSPKLEQLRKEDSPKFSSKEATRKVSSSKVGVTKIQVEVADAVKSVSDVPRITEKVPLNAKGRPKINIGRQKLKSHVDVSSDNRSGDSVFSAKHTPPNRKTEKPFEELPSSSFTNDDSCSSFESKEEKLSPEPVQADIEKRECQKPKLERFSFKSDEEYEQFKSLLVNDMPSLKPVIAGLPMHDFFPTLLNLTVAQFARTKELFSEFRRSSSTEYAKSAGDSGSTEPNTPVEMAPVDNLDGVVKLEQPETDTGEQTAEPSKHPELVIELSKYCKSDAKQAPVSTQKPESRKRKDEKERLCYDIGLMAKTTKNNILTAMWPRACRSQTPSYSYKYSRNKSFEKPKPATSGGRKASLLSGSRSKDVDSEEDEVFDCRSRRSKIEGNKSEQQKSKRKPRNSLDSEDDESETKASYRNSSKESREEVAVELAKPRQMKPCPRNVKIKLYGKEAASDFDTRCRSLSVALERVSEDDIERMRSGSERVLNSSTTTLESSVSEYNDESSWCIEKAKTSSPDSKCASSTSAEPPANEKITLKLTKMQVRKKLERYQRGLKLGKRKRKKRKKYKSDSGDEITATEAKIVSKGKVKKDVVENKSAAAADDDRIERLPRRELLKNASENVTLEIITIGTSSGQVLYSCRRSICDFRVGDVKEFARHLRTSHKDETWDGECRICGNNLNRKCDFIDALSHLVNDHMMDPLDQAQQSCDNEKDAVAESQEVQVEERNTHLDDVDLENRIANLPERNSLNGDVKSIRIGPIAATCITGCLIFSCSPSTNCDYDTHDLRMFAHHLSVVHKAGKWSGQCPVCEMQIEPNVEFLDILIHLVSEHLTFIKPAQTQEPVSEDPPLKIKEEVSDVVPPTEQKVADAPENEITAADAIERTPSPVEESFEPLPSPPPTSSPPASPPPSPPKPKIRVRRFEGDRFSGSCTAPEEVPQAVEVPEPVSTPPQPIPSASENENSKKEERLSNAKTITKVPSEAEEKKSEDNDVNHNQFSSADASEKKAKQDDLGGTSKSKESNSHVLLKKQNPITYLRLNMDDRSLMRLYKCSALNKCLFTTDDRKQFRNHAIVVHRDKKIRKKLDSEYLRCVYCWRVAQTIELLEEHITKVHCYCNYQCPYCVFRGCRPVYVYWHLEDHHINEEKKIYVSETCMQDNVEAVAKASREKEEIANVPTLRCNHGCVYETVSIGQFYEHMKRLHSQVQTLQCHLCPHMCFKLDDLVRHYNLHYIAEFQCLYCLRGFSNLDAMKSHLLLDHAHLYPRAIQRADTALNDEADTRKKFIKHVDLDQSIESLKQYLKVIDTGDQHLVTLHREDNSVTSTTVPAANDASNQDHSYYIKAAEQKTTENLESDNPTSAANLNISQSEMDRNLASPVLIADASSTTSDPNTDLSCKSIANESCAPSCSKPASRRTKFGTGLVMWLEGKKLFICGMTDCDVASDDYQSFKEHMSICDNARKTKCPTCAHCHRQFQKNINFFEHILTHGVPRFYCTLCDFKHTMSKKVGDHMKLHKIMKTKVIPAQPGRDNKNSDLFLIVPDIDVKSRGPQKINRVTSPQMAPSTANTVTQVPSSPVQQITTVYSAEEVDRLLSTQLFVQPVSCGICQYSSKVRVNMRFHMKSHDCGLPTNSDIVNPVPRVEKTELMFNKMTNHAAFAVKNDTKKNNSFTKIEKSDNEEDKGDSTIPAYVPRSLRFSCGASGCNYVTQDEKGLKDHFEGLHKDLPFFRCPHCGIPTSVAKISLHFRYHKEKLYKCAYCDYVHYKSDGIAKHHGEKHEGKALNVQIVRELEQTEVERINKETKFGSMFAGGAKSAMSSFKCMLCRSGNSVSEILIRAHCRSAHGIEHKFKCSLCSFSHDVEEEITSHLRSVHKSMSLYVVHVYKEIQERNETPIAVKVPNSTTQTCAPRVAASKRTDFKAPSSTPRDSSKEVPVTNTATNVENSEKVNEIFASIKEKNDLCVRPYTSGVFKCPKCPNFRSLSLDETRNHIYGHLNYVRFVCGCCGVVGITENELESHTHMRDEVHARTNDNIIYRLTQDMDLENKVEEALDYQHFIMKQMMKDKKPHYNNDTATNTDVVDITHISSDEESSSLTNSRKVSSDSNCSYVFSETEGPVTTGRKRNASQVSASPRKKVNSNSTCTIPHAEMKKSPSSYMRSPMKHNQRYTEATNLLESSEHKQTRLAESETKCTKCRMCSSVFCTTNQLAKHINSLHEPFACLHCSRIFVGQKNLQSHIEVSVHLDNENLLNEECKPIKSKVVRIMCPHCPFSSIGNTYLNYFEVAEHNRNAHPGKVDQKNDEIEVEVDGGGRRKLASFEISRLQVEANRASKTQLDTNQRKRRNVAIKSTARIPPSASSEEPSSKVRFIQSSNGKIHMK